MVEGWATFIYETKKWLGVGIIILTFAFHLLSMYFSFYDFRTLDMDHFLRTTLVWVPSSTMAESLDDSCVSCTVSAAAASDSGYSG